MVWWVAVSGRYYDMLLARDQVELQVILDVVGKYAMKWRFRFNSKKSKTRNVGGECSGGENGECGSVQVS